MPSDPNNLHFCTICGKELSLKEAKTDDKGNAVHEACYATKLEGKSRFRRTLLSWPYVLLAISASGFAYEFIVAVR